MSYLEPFSSIALFEKHISTSAQQRQEKIDERKFVSINTSGWRRPASGCAGSLPADLDARMPLHSDKPMITLRLLGLDRVISVGECGVLKRVKRLDIFEDLGGGESGSENSLSG